jgi:hypothetical protein
VVQKSSIRQIGEAPSWLALPAIRDPAIALRGHPFGEGHPADQDRALEVSGLAGCGLLERLVNDGRSG